MKIQLISFYANVKKYVIVVFSFFLVLGMEVIHGVKSLINNDKRHNSKIWQWNLSYSWNTYVSCYQKYKKKRTIQREKT